MRFMLHHNGVHQQCHRKIHLCIEYLPKHRMMIPNLPPTPLTVLGGPKLSLTITQSLSLTHDGTEDFLVDWSVTITSLLYFSTHPYHP